MKYTFMSGR